MKLSTLRNTSAGSACCRFDSNVGFVQGCNAGLAISSADAVLYLNNDVELAEGAIPAAMRRLQADASIGAVGAKVIRTHGVLQEAGCIIWRDGWTVGYQRDQSPLIPEVNFVRDVAFCSAVFLLVRASVLKELGGFDDAFTPAYFEDADLCMRIQESGYRVVYDPTIAVYHFEYGTSSAASAAHQRIQEAHQVFIGKHAKALRLRHGPCSRAELFARSVNQSRGRVLLIDDRLPLRRLGSGFVRSNDIVGIMAGLGYQVTVYPIHPNDQNLASVYADFPDTVEVVHDRSQGELEQFLKIRRGYYSTIWIARSHNLDLVKPIIERCGADVMGVRMVLDTEAIAATREDQRHALSGSSARVRRTTGDSDRDAECLLLPERSRGKCARSGANPSTRLARCQGIGPSTAACLDPKSLGPAGRNAVRRSDARDRVAQLRLSLLVRR